MKIIIVVLMMIYRTAATDHGPLLAALARSRLLNTDGARTQIIIKQHTNSDLTELHHRDKRNLLLGLAAGAIGGGVVGVGLLKAGVFGAKALGAGALGGIFAAKTYGYGHGPDEGFGYGYGSGFGSGFGHGYGHGIGQTYGPLFGPGHGSGYGTSYGPGYGPGYGYGHYGYGAYSYGCRCWNYGIQPHYGDSAPWW